MLRETNVSKVLGSFATHIKRGTSLAPEFIHEYVRPSSSVVVLAYYYIDSDCIW
jgi:hypothetical protein